MEGRAQRSPTTLAIAVLAAITWILAIACEGGGACEEDIRAQVIEEEAELMVGEQIVVAEVANTDVERERGWKHRRCDREALLLLAPSDGTLSMWGCGLTEAVDVFWIRDGEVIAIDGAVEPCAEPCGTCAIISVDGEEQPVDAALEVPQGALRASVGEVVVGLDRWLPADP